MLLTESVVTPSGLLSIPAPVSPITENLWFFLSNTSTLPQALSATKILPSLSACTAYGLVKADAASLPMIVSLSFLPNVSSLTSSDDETLYRYFILGGSGGSGHISSTSFCLDAQPVIITVAITTNINLRILIFPPPPVSPLPLPLPPGGRGKGEGGLTSDGM